MIKVDAISKTYQVWASPLSRLLVPMAHRFMRPFASEQYQRLYDKYCTEVHALNNVSFALEQGDSLGIVGLNGSGKSTLLQIVAGTMKLRLRSVKTIWKFRYGFDGWTRNERILDIITP